MSDADLQRVLGTLRAMSTTGLPAAKDLFCSELNYDYVDEPLPTRRWPASVRAGLARDPVLLAQHDAGTGTFDIIHVTLNAQARGRTFPLSIAAERHVIEHLLVDHPYALFLFSDEDGHHWHFVNVKVRREDGEEAPARAVMRRLSVGPEERLRTAAERLALLDLAALSPDLTGLSPLAIQQQHDVAFDVERVTQDFFTTYRRIFERAEGLIAGLPNADDRRLFTQRLFNRLLFIVFLERKGWLTFAGRSDYLRALWDAYQSRALEGEDNFYRDRLKLLFFSGLNNPANLDIVGIHRKGILPTQIGQVPYLNGGLFEQEDLDQRDDVVVPDAIFAEAIDALLYHYNFTVTESTPLDIEVAVDPEMLGRIFEELVTGRHETGSYYTPKPVVAFMCREALKGYLEDTCPPEEIAALAAFVDARDATGIRDPERVLGALQTVRACDPACGSGAYLVGLLHELVDLRQALFHTRGLDARAVYNKKLDIIQNNLYGVDLDPFAVNIARLRLWLSLIVDFEGDVPPPLPNLAYKIEVGDSLTGPAPTQLQPDLFHHQLVQDYFALKGRFMMAHGPEKRDLQARIETVKQEIADWAGTAGDPHAFDWTVEFAEIFTGPGDGAATLTGGMTGIVNAAGGQMQLAARDGREPGFDIIVANPPYVRQELLSQEQKERFRTVYPETYTGTADLYVYFYARALHLLREGGVAAIISSNKWLRAGYGKKLRAHLAAQTEVEAIIDFGDLPLFTAAAYPMIIVFGKAAPADAHALRALQVEDLAVVDRLPEVVTEAAWHQPQTELNVQGWTLVRPGIHALLGKLRDRQGTLADYVGDDLYRGVLTGRNEAFVIDEATRETLLAKDPRSAELIKPWLRGRNIERWRVRWNGEYLIAVQNSDDEHACNSWGKAETEAQALEIFRDSYSAIYDHLRPYKQRLRKRWDKGKYWWELRACTYYAEFDKPKIVYQEIATYQSFAFVEEPFLMNNKCFFIPRADLFLLAILNSPVVWFFLGYTVSKLRGDAYAMQTPYVRQIPIPTPTDRQRRSIEALVRQLLDAKGQGPQVAAWERELNALVYEVYDLTPDEIALVERETAGT